MHAEFGLVSPEVNSQDLEIKNLHCNILVLVEARNGEKTLITLATPD
jgi:hypothetical protein